MGNYGLKTSVTCVMNGDKYDLGFTYNDSHGNSIDRQLNGDVKNIGSDITKAVLDAYLDIAAKPKPKVEPAAQSEDESIMTSTPIPASPANMHANKFAELEEENRRLNERVDELLHKRDAAKKDGGEQRRTTPLRKRYDAKKRSAVDDPFDLIFNTDFKKFFDETPWF